MFLYNPAAAAATAAATAAAAAIPATKALFIKMLRNVYNT